MPTPKAGYRLKDGTRVPSVTTITGRFKESGGLLYWAFEQGASGLVRSLDDAKQPAADIGTAVHEAVELHTMGKRDDECRAVFETRFPFDTEKQAKCISGYEAYLAWAKNFKVQIVEREVQLVSEKHRYGGTPDAIGMIGGELVLLDWKTSNAIYSDYLIQLAAYARLWDEHHPDRPITGGHHLLRFSKEHGDFHHAYYPKLDEGWRQFLLFREAFEIDKQLKKRAA